MTSDFLTQLPILLRLLADPRTPHTSSELWCRVTTFGWEECEPVLLAELKSDNSDVQRLVIAIVEEQAEHAGIDSIQNFVRPIVTLLSHDDRLVRVCAVSAVGGLMIDDQNAADSLRQIVCKDEPTIARSALQVLLAFDDKFVQEVAEWFRDRSTN